MSKHSPTNRKESGRLLQANVKRLNDRNYQVKSLTRDEVYKIRITSIGGVYSCADQMFRGVKCKHIYAVDFSLKLGKTVKIRKIEPVSITDCKIVNPRTVFGTAYVTTIMGIFRSSVVKTIIDSSLSTLDLKKRNTILKELQQQCSFTLAEYRFEM